MKYIMFERVIDNKLVQRLPILFPNVLTHSEVHDALAKTSELEGFKAVSAGFTSSLGLNCNCNGESEILKLKANPVDSYTILMYDYENGLMDKGDNHDTAEK